MQSLERTHVFFVFWRVRPFGFRFQAIISELLDLDNNNRLHLQFV